MGMDQVGGSNFFEPRRIVPRWWVLILVAVIAAGVAAVASQRVPRASSSATFVLSAASDIDSPFDVSSSLSVLRGREVISTFADILESGTVRDEAVAQTAAPVANRYEVEASVLPGSNIVKLEVTGPASGVPQEVAVNIGEVAAERFVELYPIYRIDQLDAASAPARSAGGTIRNMFIAAVVGVVIAGLVLAVIPERGGQEPATTWLEAVPPIDEPEPEVAEAPVQAVDEPSSWRWQGQQ
jgi:capsular polysaccharide biosynthesis protein